MSGVERKLLLTASPELAATISGSTPACRQAICSEPTLSLLIWSSGEYLVLPASPPWKRQAPSPAPACAHA